MERWTALLPDRTPALTRFNGASHTHRPKVKLLGRLPEEAYLSILPHLALADLASCASTCRSLAQLARDDRVWAVKLDWLSYKGPGQIHYANQKRGSESHNDPQPPSAPNGVKNDQRPPQEPYRDDDDDDDDEQPSKEPHHHDDDNDDDDDDDFGDFFRGKQPSVPAIESSTLAAPTTAADDGFGDFQDAAQRVDDPFNLATDDFAHVDLNPPSNALPKTADAADLMLIFDDDDQDRAVVPPAAPSATPTSSSSSRNRPLSVSSTTTTTGETLDLYHVFKTHYSLLLPYYSSLLTHTTSSLVFTSNLQPMWRARILASLVRFCQPLVAPTRSVPQRMTVLRNTQSAMDFFESALLAEFERADTKGDEKAMKEKAYVLWELNQSPSVIQVFIQKREIFYDQSHNPLKNLTKLTSPEGHVSDGIDFTAMDTYMRYVLQTVERDGSLLARAFPPEADVLIFYIERIANDVVSDYITTLLSSAQDLPHPLFLLATAATFGQVYRLVEMTLSIEPKSPLVTRSRAEDVIFKMFEPLMDDYLTEEGEWIKEVLKGICSEWDAKTASSLAISDPTFLASANPAQVKKNVLAGFAKVLLLPVTIIPKTAEYGLQAITIGATGAFNTFANLGSQLGSGSGGNKSGTRTPSASSFAATSATPVLMDDPNVVVPPPLSNTTAALESTTSAWGGDDRYSIPPPSNPSLKPSFSRNRSVGPDSRRSSTTTLPHSRSTTEPSSSRYDRMQLLLSLDTALQLIQADRDCLKRIQTFAKYPGIYGRKVRDAIEEVFIVLLQTLGEKHVVPAFRQATKSMGLYRAQDHEGEGSVAPLVQFFELVHIGDTIQQMVEVYFEKEMLGFKHNKVAYIDRRDFLNVVIREKKKFESSLDDAVAQGLNAGVNILMHQVEHIITTQQSPSDYCPPGQAEMELNSTRACANAIETLTTHCDMLRGSTDKQILEVFHQEVGIRLHGILLKHLKRCTVSIDGGFTLIADLNAFHSFVQSLRQPTVTAYFASLKMVGELFIVDSPKELGALVRDVSRYEGTLSADDLYEIVQRRADWRQIESQVEKQLFGLKLADDCIIS
ncbi:BZ3500_MvSof-1268-A1-R1_Chr2-1g04266 [Microbotryum saponariae]|uniref:BZ3500_MvSof-1268-A1-R1_Chr2-1g04266 protein n=1 Tax=Microbotryum saponariae TaxID=289078 RepID=A0A2X0K6X2_9BASI|nr:BZ3500_MvSof-1268-A1-R1_Chr2-1g04266 [Microbotryum saponariae]SCZ91267.1 BZ3501_MvSof-1269-A2-R1_Chr2-1g03922 [Microbotryum saponariae]